MVEKYYKRQNHEKMIVWQMADKVDCAVQNILKKIPTKEFSMRSQIDRASDSIGSNFIEGYYSNSTKEFLRFCRYAQRSAGELQERLRRVLRKGFITTQEYGHVADMIIKTGYLLDRLMLALMNDTKDKNS